MITIHDHKVEKVGKFFSGSKEKIIWRFTIKKNRFDIVLTVSHRSKKIRLMLNGYLVKESISEYNYFEHIFEERGNQFKVDTDFKKSNLYINEIPFESLYYQNDSKIMHLVKFDSKLPNNAAGS